MTNPPLPRLEALARELDYAVGGHAKQNAVAIDRHDILEGIKPLDAYRTPDLDRRREGPLVRVVDGSRVASTSACFPAGHIGQW